MKAREAARAFTSSNISLVPGRRGRQPLVGAENAEGPALEPGLRFSLPRRSRRLNLRRVVALVNPRLLLAALTYYSLADAAELLAAGCLPRQAPFPWLPARPRRRRPGGGLPAASCPHSRPGCGCDGGVIAAVEREPRPCRFCEKVTTEADPARSQQGKARECRECRNQRPSRVRVGFRLGREPLVWHPSDDGRRLCPGWCQLWLESKDTTAHTRPCRGCNALRTSLGKDAYLNGRLLDMPCLWRLPGESAAPKVRRERSAGAPI